MKISNTIELGYALVYSYMSRTRSFWNKLTLPFIEMTEEYSELVGSGLHQVSAVLYYLLVTLPVFIVPLTVSAVVTGSRPTITTNLLVSLPNPVYMTTSLLLAAGIGTLFRGIYNEEKPFPTYTGLATICTTLLIPFVPSQYQVGMITGLICVIGILSSGRVGTWVVAYTRHLGGTITDHDEVINKTRLAAIFFGSIIPYSFLSILYYNSQPSQEEYIAIGLFFASYFLTTKIREYSQELLSHMSTKHTSVRWLILSYAFPVAGITTALTATGFNKLVVIGLLVSPFVGMVDFMWFVSNAKRRQRNSGEHTVSTGDSEPVSEVDISSNVKPESGRNNADSEMMVEADFTIGVDEFQQKKPSTRVENVKNLIYLRQLVDRLGDQKDSEQMKMLVETAGERAAMKIDPESDMLNEIPQFVQEKIVETEDTLQTHTKKTKAMDSKTMDELVQTGRENIESEYY